MGQRAAAEVVVTNLADRRTFGTRMELRVGDGHAEFLVPGMARGESHEEPFVLPTVRRGIIVVGPAVSVRTDPLGIYRRTQSWTNVLELIVHPRVVRLAELGTGFVRDLEGLETKDRADSDISFHSLRAYEPGDDQRHIHWLSTARTGTLQVRQFIDTRRSHVALLVDGGLRTYSSEDEFEMAISVAGSLGTRVLLDDQIVTCVVGIHRVPAVSRNTLLDGLAAVEGVNRDGMLGVSVGNLVRTASGMSLAVVVTGRHTTISDLRKITLRFPSGVRVLVMRMDQDTPTSFQPLGSHLLLSLRSLDDLAHLLWAVAT
jgi:uncharacterized protein (DUF58 family)